MTVVLVGIQIKIMRFDLLLRLLIELDKQEQSMEIAQLIVISGLFH
jgi:hypothetical protein